MQLNFTKNYLLDIFRFSPGFVVASNSVELTGFSDNSYATLIKPRKKLNILLVEDVPIVQKVHSQLLEKLGHHVTLARNAEEFFQVLHGNYDLILMDIGLPDANGVEITAQICSRNTTKIPVIGLTAFEIDEVKADCLAAGMSAVLNKPIAINALQHAIEEVLKDCSSNKI